MNNRETFMDNWLSIDATMNNIEKDISAKLKSNYNMSIKGFYVLYYISKSPDKALRLQQLEEKVGLSQSALSRLVARLESNNCGALEKYVSATDRRGTYTKLTKLGEEKLKNGLQDFQEVVKKYLSHDELEIIFNKLNANFVE